MKFTDLFKKSLSEPESATEKKWYSVGFFTAVFFAAFTCFPLLSGIQAINQNVAGPWARVTLLLLFCIPYLIVLYKKGQYALNFSHNFAITIVRDIEASKQKKQKPEAA